MSAVTFRPVAFKFSVPVARLLRPPPKLTSALTSTVPELVTLPATVPSPLKTSMPFCETRYSPAPASPLSVRLPSTCTPELLVNTPVTSVLPVTVLRPPSRVSVP